MDYNNQLQYHRETGILQTEDERQMGLYLHISALANMIIPFAGYVIPIVIWQTQKEKMPAIEAHGKEAANWMISSFVYSFALLSLLIIGGVLFFASEAQLLGILLFLGSFLALIGLSIASIFYAVKGGIKADSGEHWEYPLNIKFLK